MKPPGPRVLTVSCPLQAAEDAADAAERFRSPPARWLPLPIVSRGRDRWLMALGVGGAHRTVLLELGEPWRVNGDVWRACSWRPLEEDGDILSGPRWLPGFHGSLGVVMRTDALQLVLHGTYTAPLGRVGTVLDRVLLGRLAQHSARALLNDIAQSLTQRPRVASMARRSAR